MILVSSLWAPITVRQAWADVSIVASKPRWSREQLSPSLWWELTVSCEHFIICYQLTVSSPSQPWGLSMVWVVAGDGIWRTTIFEKISWNVYKIYEISWCHDQMETVSALLVLCEENSSVTGGFPSQRASNAGFDVFFDVSINKQSSRWWFETRGCLLWCQCNVAWFVFVFWISII